MKATLLILLSVVVLMLPCGLGEPGVNLGCLPSDRLVFDHNTTTEESKLLNKHFFDCPNPEPGVPCFFYKDIVISSENGASYIMFFLAGYIIVEFFNSLNLFFAVFMNNFQLSVDKERKSGESTDFKEAERQPTERTEAGVKEEPSLEAPKETVVESKQRKKRTELVARYQRLLATMEEQHHKYRSQACLQKQLVKTFMANTDQ